MQKDIQGEGKLSENKILLVMVLLVAVILVLNWMAYHSVNIEVPSQELLAGSQDSDQTSKSKPPKVD